MSLKVRHFIPLLSTLGPGWVVRRARMRIESLGGGLRRRTPQSGWDALAACGMRGCGDWARVGCGLGGGEAEAEELLAGRIRVFSGRYETVGNPPDWFLNLCTGERVAADGHWTEIGDFSQGDIKGVWEASRWSWAWVLVRAWQATGDDRYPELFWTWLEDWMEKNPPNTGPQWKCGQEASMRLFAAAFAGDVFRDHPSSTGVRMEKLSRLAHASGLRIASHLGYAVSQDNNHGISEAVGLVTAGILWPDLPRAGAWLGQGLETLGHLCERLVAPDGSFSQHSSNYHRVMLDDLCFAAAIVRRAGLGLADEVQSAGFRAGCFLERLTVSGGAVMRYGSDDGARVLQLSGCGYADFRPTLAACCLFFGSPDPGPGPWWEQAQQLDVFSGGAGRAVAVSRRETGSVREPEGGIHIRRRGSATVLFRAPTKFRFRPAHADHLQISVHDGERFLVEDVGSYSYNDPGKRWSGLSSSVFHNVPTVDGEDPMERVSRFLWLPWTACRLEVNEADRLVASFEGPNHFLVRREVQIRVDHCIVLDHIEGYREAELAVRWHGRDRDSLAGIAVSCSNPGVVESWYHGDAESGLGLHAPTYHHLEPSWCRQLTVRAVSASFRSVIRWGREGEGKA
jgi:hypothetical protein